MDRKASQNVPEFAWDGAREKAADRVADGKLTTDEIAAEAGVDRRTLTRWKQHPEFMARVKETVEQLGEASARFAVGRRLRRLQALDERWRAMQAVIAARAADPELQSAPGGATGLLVRNRKMIGSGDAAREVVDFAVDTGLLDQLLEHEKRAAQECGQWVDKVAATTPDGTKPHPLVERVREIIHRADEQEHIAPDAPYPT